MRTNTHTDRDTMQARDMFIEQAMQIFDRSTGEWIATVKPGEKVEHIEPLPAPQLSLFMGTQLNLF